MKSKAPRLSVLLAVLVGFAATVLPVAPAEAQWVFVARKALGRIQHMAEAQQQGGRPGYDFATVLLDAPADKVFATALELARKNPAVRVVMQDPGQRRFQIAEGDRTATLNVVPFSDDVSQLLIAGHAASPAEGRPPRAWCRPCCACARRWASTAKSAADAHENPAVTLWPFVSFQCPARLRPIALVQGRNHGPPADPHCRPVFRP
jgi:hypothetical protein